MKPWEIVACVLIALVAGGVVVFVAAFVGVCVALAGEDRGD